MGNQKEMCNHQPDLLVQQEELTTSTGWWIFRFDSYHQDCPWKCEQLQRKELFRKSDDGKTTKGGRIQVSCGPTPPLWVSDWVCIFCGLHNLKSIEIPVFPWSKSAKSAFSRWFVPVIPVTHTPRAPRCPCQRSDPRLSPNGPRRRPRCSRPAGVLPIHRGNSHEIQWVFGVWKILWVFGDYYIYIYDYDYISWGNSH